MRYIYAESLSAEPRSIVMAENRGHKYIRKTQVAGG